MKAHKLRGKPQAELLKQLEELKKELSQLRVAKSTGTQSAKIGRITEVRKGIARVLTVHNQKEKADARLKYKGKKFIPKDLRHKKTRAKRRELPYSLKIKMTVRKTKRVQNLPRRKYALLA